MIEIVLRKDIREFEPKPIFGYTYRQAAAGLAIAFGSVLIHMAVSKVAPGTIASMSALIFGAVVGFIGWGRPGDLKPEVWARIRYEEWSMPACMPHQLPHFEKPEAHREKADRTRRRALKRELSTPEYEL